MEDENLLVRLTNMRTNVHRNLDPKTSNYAAKALVPITLEELNEVFDADYIIDDGDAIYSRNSLQALLDTGDLARFNVPNDVLHLRRKADNKEVLEIVANNAQVILVFKM